MRVVSFTLISAALAVSAQALSGFPLRRQAGSKDTSADPLVARELDHEQLLESRAASNAAPRFLNAKTKPFYVPGNSIPSLNFDAGESYSGLLPISSNAKETRKLFSWYFPISTSASATNKAAAADEILIWLNGGPACSSLEGLLQENGPFSWQYGTYEPILSPWSWNKLTNVVWVEQPVGTGFSQGVPDATSSAAVAKEFAGWFQQFVNTFDLQGKKVYIAGESYSGTYIPYIANEFLNRNDKVNFGLTGTLMYDPLIGPQRISDTVPLARFTAKWQDLLGLNDTFVANITARAQSCGYTDYINRYLVYPPKGVQPTMPSVPRAGCDLQTDILNAWTLVNPCADIYQIATTCPTLWDVLQYPGSYPYVAPGTTSAYFDRADVKAAIHAPNVTWSTCAEGTGFATPDGSDLSDPPNYKVLGSVIDRSVRTVIAHGLLDFVLLSEGSLLAIQNTTFGGKMGFQTAPTDTFIVPKNEQSDPSTWAGYGAFGTAHYERGLMWSTVKLAGHMVPQYAPAAATRHLQYLLGRINSLKG
ncbi:hypothetical protein HKX48_005704 [Thoreauomyces humboldtii]|nr:hypothetical protein HKX48_005704 [Thoreauomyces humboldtii]